MSEKDSGAGFLPAETLALLGRIAPLVYTVTHPKAFLSAHTPGQGNRRYHVLSLKGLRAFGWEESGGKKVQTENIYGEY